MMKAIVPAWRANSFSNAWLNEFDHVFDSLFEQQPLSRFRLDCDVEESDKYVLFSFDLPGMEEKDINIEVKDSMLVVSGERKIENLESTSKTHRGRQFGSFKHMFRLPQNVDKEKIEADYTNGVLKVLLTKQEEPAPKKIEIKTTKGESFSQLLKSQTPS